MKKSFKLNLKLRGCEKMFQNAETGEDLGPGIVSSCIVDSTLESEKDLENPMFAVAVMEQMDAFIERTVEVLVESLP